MQKWRKAVPRADREMSCNDRLCEKHFEESCLIRFYQHKMPDGSVVKIERGRTALIPGSIPTIFPNLPKYLSGPPTKKRKGPGLSPTDKKICFETNMPEESISSLIKDLDKIVRPSEGWIVVPHNNQMILCFKLNDNFQYERHLIVEQDFTLKVSSELFKNISNILLTIKFTC